METVVKMLQEHEDGMLENITKSISDVLDTAELLNEGCCKTAVEMETCLKESFAAFSMELQECFFLDAEKQLLEKRLCFRRNKLQERFNQNQLETTKMLQNVNDGLVQSISTQTTSFKQ